MKSAKFDPSQLRNRSANVDET